jgi:hypothetical protein
MAEVRTRGGSTSRQREDQKEGDMRKLGLSKMIFVVSMFCIAAAIASPAQTFTTLVNFDFTGGTLPVRF